MCTTSTECRIVMIVVLTVMSSMDPHTIKMTWVGMVGKSGVVQSCTLGLATTVDTVVCSMSHFEKWF
jgi:hypothetical protein